MRYLLIAIVLSLVAASLAGSGLVAQEETPEGRLGGGMDLDETPLVETLPPSPSATPGTPTPDDASPASDLATPVASVTSIPGASGPEECTVTPRTLAELNRLLNGPGTAQPLATPSAEHWAAGDGQAAIETVRQLVACANAGNQLAALALVSDELAVEALTGDPQMLPAAARILLADRPQIERIRIAALRIDGIGVVVLELAPLRYPALTEEQRRLRFTLALSGGRWLITTVVDGTVSV